MSEGSRGFCTDSLPTYIEVHIGWWLPCNLDERVLHGLALIFTASPRRLLVRVYALWVPRYISAMPGTGGGVRSTLQTPSGLLWEHFDGALNCSQRPSPRRLAFV